MGSPCSTHRSRIGIDTPGCVAMLCTVVGVQVLEPVREPRISKPGKSVVCDVAIEITLAHEIIRRRKRERYVSVCVKVERVLFLFLVIVITSLLSVNIHFQPTLAIPAPPIFQLYFLFFFSFVTFPPTVFASFDLQKVRWSATRANQHGWEEGSPTAVDAGYSIKSVKEHNHPSFSLPFV